jgi:Na+-transporting NADH:ubiquinone oxidoreductase subunit NqrC
MLNKILTSVCLILLITCTTLYFSLESTKKSLRLSQDSVVLLESSVKSLQDEKQKADNLRKKHEEIIAELFVDQDTTQEQFEDLEGKFKALRDSRVCPRPSLKKSGDVSETNPNIVDFSSHQRLLSEAACLGGDKGSCTSATSSK